MLDTACILPALEPPQEVGRILARLLEPFYGSPPPSNGLTRRGVIGAAGASAASAAMLGSAACRPGSGASSERLNVLVVVLDSVRSDFVSAYGAPRVRTPQIDSLAAEGIRFTRFFPEAMPTVPARRTIMTGRRVFPFRGWKRTPDLGRGPGAAPIADLSQVFTRQLQRAGYWTASASDNPFLGFTKSFRPYRLTFGGDDDEPFVVDAVHPPGIDQHPIWRMDMPKLGPMFAVLTIESRPGRQEQYSYVSACRMGRGSARCLCRRVARDVRGRRARYAVRRGGAARGS